MGLPPERPTAFAMGFWTNCAIGADGKAVCWGYDQFGQSEVPAALGSVAQLSLGTFHSCALADGAVSCWGDNHYNQLSVPASSHPVQISAGYYHTCALADSGVSCWGFDGYGQLEIPALDHPTEIASGDHHVCALTAAGSFAGATTRSDRPRFPSWRNRSTWLRVPTIPARSWPQARSSAGATTLSIRPRLRRSITRVRSRRGHSIPARSMMTALPAGALTDLISSMCPRQPPDLDRQQGRDDLCPDR